MRWAVVENDQVTSTFRSPTGVQISDVKYPANIFDLWSEAQLNAIGVYIVVEDSPVDPNFYTLGSIDYTYANGVVTETRNKTEKSVATLKNELTTRIKTECNMYLRPTDWYVIRQSETVTKTMPDDVKTDRNGLRTKAEALEDSINNATTHAELMALDLSWS
jgi:hypothetical protein